MIQSHIGHLVYHIDTKNLAFYKDLLTFLGWSVRYADETGLGMADSNGASLWFGDPIKPVVNDYDGPGLNHLAIAAASVADVDAAVDWLKARGVPALFNTPCHRPEFSRPGSTYYQVMFETPDRLLLEIVYSGTLP